jgi:hypothetical protein
MRGAATGVGMGPGETTVSGFTAAYLPAASLSHRTRHSTNQTIGWCGPYKYLYQHKSWDCTPSWRSHPVETNSYSYTSRQFYSVEAALHPGLVQIKRSQMPEPLPAPAATRPGSCTTLSTACGPSLPAPGPRRQSRCVAGSRLADTVEACAQTGEPVEARIPDGAQ